MKRFKTTSIVMGILLTVVFSSRNGFDAANRDPDKINNRADQPETQTLSWIDVTEYGAIGDGITDDSAAIQNAINDAVSNHNANPDRPLLNTAKVYFPPGVYLCKSTVTFKPFINYEGVRATIANTADWTTFADSRGSIIRAHTNIYDNDADSGGVLVYIPTGDITIRDLTFIGTSAIDGSPSVGMQFASSAEISEYERKHHVFIPHELREWLEVCNGTYIIGGDAFGINQDEYYLEIAEHYKYREFWKTFGWVPISSDQCGDYYVLDTRNKIGRTHPVYFVDQCDYSKPDYVVASGLWKFLRFKIIDEILFQQNKDDYWPFDKDKVLAEDPDIILCKTAPIPWETDCSHLNPP